MSKKKASPDLEKRLPFAQSQMVTVVFSAANTDFDILHSLTPLTPNGISYIPLRQSAAGVVYEDVTGTRKPWQNNLIYLRSSVIMTADLLLVVLPT